MATLKVKEGKTYPFYIVYKDANGFVIDITGATARMMVRHTAYGDVMLTKTGFIDGPNGKITLDIEVGDTLGWLGGTKSKEEYLFDVELTLANNDEIIILEGEFIVTKPITRD